MSTISPSAETVYELAPSGSAPTTAAGDGGRFRRLIRGPQNDPRWARPSLLALLAVTAVLYLWDLSASGWGNSFYAAAVQAGTKSWKAMLFGSLDAGNAITVDKPPASLWAMEISGRIFGFSSWSMLAPQALMGVATVAVVYASVKRVLTKAHNAAIGAGAGLLAAAALAVTPVAVLMFKFNNPDAMLTLLLTLAVYAVVRAQENGSTKWLLTAGVLIGFAFLTKSLQAFLILPALALVYLATGPGKFLRRLWQLAAAAGAIVVSAGWWVAIVQLTPASSRPYIGGSQHNSFLELTFGYNGFGRLTGNEVGSVGGRGGLGRALSDPSANGLVTGTLPAGARLPGVTIGGPRGGFANGRGLLRMFGQEVGGQVSWLLPAALLLLVVGLWAAGRARRTDPARSALLAWGLSMLSTAAVFSFMAGIFHPYYTVALAPLIAATAGIGAGMLWARREQLLARVGLAGAVGVTAWWGFVLLGRDSGWNDWLRYVVVVVGVLAAVVLVAGPFVAGRRASAAAGDRAAGVSADSAGAAGMPSWAAGQGSADAAGMPTWALGQTSTNPADARGEATLGAGNQAAGASSLSGSGNQAAGGSSLSNSGNQAAGASSLSNSGNQAAGASSLSNSGTHAAGASSLSGSGNQVAGASSLSNSGTHAAGASSLSGSGNQAAGASSLSGPTPSSSEPTAAASGSSAAHPSSSADTRSSGLSRILRWSAIALGVGAVLLGPAAYAVATTKVPHTGSIPSAGPSSGFGPGGMRRLGGPGGFFVPNNGRQNGQGGFPGGQGFGGNQNPNGQQGFPGSNGQLPPGGNLGGTNGGQGFPGQQNGNAVIGGSPGAAPGFGFNGENRGGNNLLDASTPGAQIQALLKQNASSYRWAAAAIGAQNAAGYQLATGDAVMAIGGFNGSDPSPTLAQFQQYVAQHQIHYYIAGGIGMGANGGADEGSAIGNWVKAHYQAQTVDGVTIYDLSAAPTS